PLAVDASGNFSFATTLPLDGTADGTHTVHLRATDNAGNVSEISSFIFTLATGTRLVEGTRFVTPLEKTFVVPAQPSKLEFRFLGLNFDTRANFIQYAF